MRAESRLLTSARSDAQGPAGDHSDLQPIIRRAPREVPGAEGLCGGGSATGTLQRMDTPCAPCVAELGTMPDRLDAMRAAIAQEREPIVTLTHLLKLCRSEHAVLWEQVGDPQCHDRVTAILGPLRQAMPDTGTTHLLDREVREALVAALASDDEVRRSWSRTRWPNSSTYVTATPSPPGSPGAAPTDPAWVTRCRWMGPISVRPSTWRPPRPRGGWRSAWTKPRRVRLAGEWAVQFRIVFDYALADTLAGLISADTVLATCHPNRSLDEFTVPTQVNQPAFPVHPIDLDRQHTQIDRLIAHAAAAHASIVVLPELCVTEAMAAQLQDWVRRANGPRLLVAGSYHHEDDHGDTVLPHRRRNTAIAWVRGHDRPLTHDKHSPAARPVLEDIQPQGWPELRVYVTRDGWHLVIAICRDLLNPHAVYALTEAGVNLALVPAMSESLVSFGGPAANLVGTGQAIVAVANNPAHWPSRGDVAARRAARALFGHPGWDQQTRSVHTPDADPGVAARPSRRRARRAAPGLPRRHRPGDRRRGRQQRRRPGVLGAGAPDRCPDPGRGARCRARARRSRGLLNHAPPR